MTHVVHRHLSSAFRKPGLHGLLGLLGIAAALAWWLTVTPAAPRRARSMPEEPVLFEGSRSCPRSFGAEALGRELEEHAQYRADRYPYDPHDGVLAVFRYQEAESCYRVAGRHDEASRAAAAALTLTALIEADYAAARTSLVRALDSKHWSSALEHARQLRLLTRHLGDHDYVDWLDRTMGWLSTREDVAL